MFDLMVILCYCGLSILFTLYLLIKFIITYINYSTKSKVQDMLSIARGYSEKPDYSPALIAYYINNKKLRRKDRLATIFDLIGRGYIEVIKEGNATNFKLKLTNKDTSNLNEHELLIINCFKEKEVNYEDISSFMKETKKNITPLLGFEFLVSKQEDKSLDGKNKKTIVIERKTRIAVWYIGVILSLIPVFIIALPAAIMEFFGLEFLYDIISNVLWTYIFITNSYNLNIIETFTLLPIISIFILLSLKALQLYLIETNIYYSTFNLSKSIEYRNWIGFKRNLKHYSNNTITTDMKQLESYYAYAVVFDCQREFLRKLKKINNKNNLDLTNLEYFAFLTRKIGNKKIKYRNNVNIKEIFKYNFSLDTFNE